MSSNYIGGKVDPSINEWLEKIAIVCANIIADHV